MNENDLQTVDTEISAYRKALREIDWYLRSKRPVIYLTTPEELRIEEGISFICNRPDHKWDFITWDLVSGLKSQNSEFLPAKKSDCDAKHPHFQFVHILLNHHRNCTVRSQ